MYSYLELIMSKVIYLQGTQFVSAFFKSVEYLNVIGYLESTT